MLNCQKDKFSIPEDVTYLNCAYMSPLLKSVEMAGIEGVRSKSQPFSIAGEDFFGGTLQLKKLFAQLINAEDPQRIAIAPSTSYGLANVSRNLPLNKGQNIVVLEEQFPSNIYTWQKLAEEKGAELRFVTAPHSTKDRGAIWNEKILAAIDENTAAVAIMHVHWADGTKYDLRAISEKIHSVGGWLIVDGTQSVGALPFDVQEIKPDALICGAYKWLMSGYSFALCYFGSALDEGNPIEDNWMNRLNSEDFQQLVNYQPQYKTAANRYCVGQQSNFVNTPMTIAALEQILAWTPAGIQDYCAHLLVEPLQELRNLGCEIESADFRAAHLFGIRLPDHINLKSLAKRLKEKQIHVSFRGSAIRVSPHLYNDTTDFERFLACF